MQYPTAGFHMPIQALELLYRLGAGTKVTIPAVDKEHVPIFTVVTQMSERVIHVLVQKHVHA